jgi:imidazolonepropionase-like amidohydrolase
MKTSVLFGFILIAAAYFTVACSESTTPASIDGGQNTTIALVNCYLIDGTGSDPIANAVIIIQDTQIKSVGTAATLAVPPGARVIDAGGMYILPGFMNTHVHGGYTANNLKEWARSGVTTVRDLGNFSYTPGEAYAMRNTLLKDDHNSRLVAAGPIVTTVGGYGNYPVTSPTDAETKINSLIDAGADLIKIAIEDDLQGRTWPMLSMEEISKIVQTAHDRNVKVSAHVSRARHLEMAMEGGVDDVNHMIIDALPDSLITRMIAVDMYWVPTLELWDGVSDLHNLNWDVIAKDNLRRFVEAGGKVAVGTDYDGYVTSFELGMPMTEIKLMHEAGMTPMQIIVAGTKSASFVCDRDDEQGTIEPGKIADIIIVPGNPLDNLNHLGDARTVIHNGTIVDDDG